MKMHDDTCKVTCVDNGKTMEAEIMAFKRGQYLVVSINQQVRLNMHYNKQVYEGNSSGLTFVSNGPN